MFTFSKILLLVLIGQPFLAQTQLYLNFTTLPQPNVTIAYSSLLAYKSVSGNLFNFSYLDTTIDFTSDNWMDPCYEEFYSNSDNRFVIFWIKGNNVSCEAVSKGTSNAAPKFPVENLMRLERKGQRCP